MKRVFAIASVAALLVLAWVLHTPLKDFLWAHPWLHSALVAVPTIALAVFAYFELHHSSEANALRSEANRLRAELDDERNKHLQQIARNTERPVSQAERNADTLRRHLGANVAVSEGEASWGSPPQIVKVSDDNVVTLFTPASYSSPNAWCVEVRCDELEITEIPQGSCPIRIKVLKRHGPHHVELGQITKWEDRFQPAANPIFAKAGVACSASYSKPGSSERRSLYVHVSTDGANLFLLEASTGERATGDNKEISKRFMLLQVEYEAAGFNRSSYGTGSSLHPLFIH